MKKVEAIIRQSKFEEVKAALHEVGVTFFTHWDVTGVGQENADYLDVKSSEKAKMTTVKSYLSIIVNDDFEAVTIKAIMEAACTEQIGDGRIFVSTIDEVYKIRTKEKGNKTLR